ncbi:MAG: dephospho-CoA kinase [Candidatus Omnitrophota bacterium]
MIIGLTGSFGSGKTTVSKMFKGLGANIIDADKVYHSLITPRERLYKGIIGLFGKDILKKDRTIDRKKLSSVVFKDRGRLRRLNSLTHPCVISEIKKISAKQKGVVILEAPLLFESGLFKDMNKIIVVKASVATQVKRLRISKGLKAGLVLERIRMQMPLKKKLAFADFIIDNDGTKKTTNSQVIKIWERLGAIYGTDSKT